MGYSATLHRHLHCVNPTTPVGRKRLDQRKADPLRGETEQFVEASTRGVSEAGYAPQGRGVVASREAFVGTSFVTRVHLPAGLIHNGMKREATLRTNRLVLILSAFNVGRRVIHWTFGARHHGIGSSKEEVFICGQVGELQSRV